MRINIFTAFVAVALLATQANAQTTLRLLNSFDGRYAATPLIVEPLIKAIQEASNGDLQIRHHGPEVVPPFEQFQPVAQGAFDILFTAQPYHIGTSSVSMGVYALDPDPVKWRETGVFDFIDKEYNRHGVKLLAMIPTTGAGVGAFQAILKQPIQAGDKPLAGIKVRGNPLYRPLIEAMGGTSVTLAGGEIYSALQRGVVDGVFWPVMGAVDFKWFEVTGYMMRPTFGSSVHFALMNLNRFNALTESQKKVILSESEKAELAGMKAMEARVSKELADLKKLGLKQTELNPDLARKLFTLFDESFWQSAIASKATGEQAKAFHEFARSKGLAK